MEFSDCRKRLVDREISGLGFLKNSTKKNRTNWKVKNSCFSNLYYLRMENFSTLKILNIR